MFRAKSPRRDLPAISGLAALQVDTRNIQTDEDVTSNHADVLALSQYVQAGSLSGSRCTHQRGERSRFHITVNVVQELQAPASFCCGGVRTCYLTSFGGRTRHRIAQLFPRKGFATVIDMAEDGSTLLIPFRLRFCFLLQRTRFWGLGGKYDGPLST